MPQEPAAQPSGRPHDTKALSPFPAATPGRADDLGLMVCRTSSSPCRCTSTAPTDADYRCTAADEVTTTDRSPLGWRRRSPWREQGRARLAGRRRRLLTPRRTLLRGASQAAGFRSNDKSVRGHIADPLAPRRDENDDEGDEVSQQPVDKPQDCADRGLSQARHLPGLLIDHPYADDHLAEGLPRGSPPSV
jgi:hypothetical protein